MELISVILFGISLCADCFAVCLCSSLAPGGINRRQVAWTAVLFSIIQTSLLLAGWGLGAAIAGVISKAGRFVSLALLLYIGGSMVREGLSRDGGTALELGSLGKIILGGIATSIDALAAGSSLSLAGQLWADTWPEGISVFVFTALSVVLGMLGGKAIGRKAGRIAEVAGGAVLIGLGIMLFINAA
ncbi:MAG: manganese efflux pump [Bacteroidales bacterium]|nr:manganese efflux pump [Candidatus Cryptobacteroides aphodequi]